MRRLVWCLPWVLFGCFDNAPEVDSVTADGSGTGSASTGAPSTSGELTGSTSADESGGTPASIGNVVLRSARVPADSIASLTASFGGDIDDCGRGGAGIGPCTVAMCGADMVQRPDAGVITFDRNQMPQAPQLEPGTLGRYVPLQLSAPPFMPGDEIAIHASGGEVPAFDVLVSAPPGVKFDQNAADLVLSAAAPLTLTWMPPPADGSGDSSVVVRMRAPTQAAVCLVNAAAGEIEIPAEVLQTLGPGALVQFEASTQRDAPVTAAPWEVAVVLAYQIEDTNGAAVFFPRTVE